MYPDVCKPFLLSTHPRPHAMASYLPQLEVPTGVSDGEFAKYKPFLSALCWEVLAADMRECAERGGWVDGWLADVV